MCVRRDTNEKKEVKIDMLNRFVELELEKMQNELFEKASKTRDGSIVQVKNVEELMEATSKGKLAYAAFSGEEADEDELKTTTKGITSRCIKENIEGKGIKCFFSGKPAKYYVYFARNY